MQLFSLPTFGKLLAICAVGVPLVLGGAYAYKKVTDVEW